MMSTGESLSQKSFELLTKWSEGQLDLLGRRQRKVREAAESALGVFRESLDGKAPEESLKKLCGNVLELYSLPLGTNGNNGSWAEYSRELQKFFAETPIAVSGNGFSEEVRTYGKKTWENGEKATSAYVNWIKALLQGQKLPVSADDAGQALGNYLSATELLVEKSVDCLLNQVRANSGFVKTSLLKEKTLAEPVQ